MNALDKVIADINKSYKQELIQKGTSMIYVEKIPFASPRANYITYGGVPKGKATEFFGPEGGGKTTSALQIVGQAQKQARKTWEDEVAALDAKVSELENKETKAAKDELKKLAEKQKVLLENGPRRVAYIDAENTLDEEWAKLNGVDIDELILARPQDQTAEQILQMIRDLVNSGLLELAVLDSIPMLVGQNVYDEDMEKKGYGGISGPLSDFSRRISPELSRSHTAFIGINQVRDNLNNPYDQYHSPGGRAWKHLCSLRLYFRKGSFIDSDNQELKNSADEPKGNLVDITVVKTKVCKPDRRLGQYTLKYDSGTDVLSDTVYMAIKYGMIVQSGSWFSIIDEDGEVISNGEIDLKFQGKPKLLEYLRDDEVIFEELYEAVNEQLKQE